MATTSKAENGRRSTKNKRKGKEFKQKIGIRLTAFKSRNLSVYPEKSRTETNAIWLILLDVRQRTL